MGGKFSFADYFAKAGPTWGGIGGLFYSSAYGIYFFRDHDLSDLAQMFFGFAFAATAYGIGRSLKRSSDIMVSSEAEKRIDNPALSVTSSVPQIQREIVKQQAENAAEVKKQEG